MFGNCSGGTAAVAAFGGGDGTTAWALSFSGTPGSWYAVEQAESLANPLWTVVTNVVIPSTGALAIELPSIGTATSMFYRAVPRRNGLSQSMETDAEPTFLTVAVP